MNCIKLHSSRLLPQHSDDLKHQRQCHLVRHTNLPRLTSIHLYGTVRQSLRFPSPTPVMTKAMPHSFVIAASSAPKSVDVSVFLQISALLLFLYFIANFIVPEFISKYFGFDQVNKDQKANDVNITKDR